MSTPELLAPAGTLKSLKYAMAYGADAIYVGLPRYSLRVRENDFDVPGLQEALNLTRAAGKKLYVACNIVAHDTKIDTFLKDMEPVLAMQPDALIVSDPGIIHILRQHWPNQILHLSVQANVVNSEAVKFWGTMGISRIILSRELSVEEMATIRERCPDMELEAFIHGALCVAYSGRCLLSGYMSHRDPNQGACTNACRWSYKGVPATQTEEGRVVPAEEPGPMYLIEEKDRPDEWMVMEEDEHGTYVFNSKDLRAIRHVEALAEMGMNSLKIEGRTKSFFYVARTVQVYRKALDAAARGEAFDPRWLLELDDLANRGYTEGFYDRHAPDEMQNYEHGSTQNSQQFIGEVLNGRGHQLHVEVKNKFAVGEALELMTPTGNHRFILSQMEKLDGTPMEVAPGSGHQVRIPIPEAIPADSHEGMLLIRCS
ncbi:prephenate-dependent tRNA uridine(34) hydroxylase TrhP [Magnetococcus sp. PR-3]|uniref:prephenate-dependent tRNA uridine(34) hydroxylase TrhP n=1 Tax=Magnetococcus sp. PR-3 TaxID=3120355 RepID=UPI002FCE00DD